MKIKKILLITIIICMGFSYLYSQDESEPSSLDPEAKKGFPPWGFIFNTNNLLLDIESYQAGVGVKVLRDNNVAHRYLADLFYSSSSKTFSGTLGLTYEKHFKPGRLSPYWGGFLDIGFMI